ncbi:MAG TPA: hypothetical protein RMH99_17680 [Sandaracinaceae bacterium LLY-WYZ-13_1]|nr:hypothetical protein [Sandaracinaceae bacterium LLY-WYZ-13_1]
MSESVPAAPTVPSPTRASVRSLFWAGRFGLETVGALLAATALFGVGWSVFEPLVRIVGARASFDGVVATSPSEPVAARAELALLLAAAPFLTWITVILHRLRARRVPGVAALVVYAIVPLAVAVGGVGLQAWLAIRVDPAPAGVALSVSLSDLLVGFWTRRVVLAGITLLFVGVLLGARRAPR